MRNFLQIFLLVVVYTLVVSSQSFAEWSYKAFDDSIVEKFRYAFLTPNSYAFLDYFTSLEWSDYRTTASGQTQSMASDYCNSMGNGYRLPTVMELQTLFSYTPLRNGVYPYACGGEFACNNTNPNIGSCYWAVNISSKFNSGWCVNFQLDYPLNNTVLQPLGAQHYARCVSGQTLSADGVRFIDVFGDNKISSSTLYVQDMQTRLIWTRGANGCLSQQEAENACSLLGTYWSLPTAKQLVSLLYYAPYQIINELAFPQESTYYPYYWTHTSQGYNNLGKSWAIVSFVDGNVTYKTSNVTSDLAGNGPEDCVFSRCVRAVEQWQPLAYADNTIQENRYMTMPNLTLDRYTWMYWAQSPSLSAMPWSNAQNYCSMLNISGVTGWRLPNTTELQSLINYPCMGTSPCINQNSGINVAAHSYWASDVGSGGGNWAMDFSNGCNALFINSQNRPALCVGGGDKSSVTNRYTDEHGNIVTSSSEQVVDIVTALVWRYNASTSYNQSASMFCASVGNGNWRVPTIKELHSLFNEINPVFQDWQCGPSGNNVSNWVSATSASPNGILVIGFGLKMGAIFYSRPSDPNCVRCVRSNP